jgi:hypothetical protein
MGWLKNDPKLMCMVGESSKAHNKWLTVPLQGHRFNLRPFELCMSQEGNPFSATLGPEFLEWQLTASVVLVSHFDWSYTELRKISVKLGNVGVQDQDCLQFEAY